MNRFQILPVGLLLVSVNLSKPYEWAMVTPNFVENHSIDAPSVVWRVRRPSFTSVPISKDVHDFVTDQIAAVSDASRPSR